MGPIGWKELLFIAVILMILFGAKKLPELARSLRKSVDEFKKGSDDDDTPGERDAGDANRANKTTTTKSTKTDTAAKN